MSDDKHRQLSSQNGVNPSSSYSTSSFLGAYDASHSTNLTKYGNSARRSVERCTLALDGQESSYSDQQTNIKRYPTPNTIYSSYPNLVQSSYSTSGEMSTPVQSQNLDNDKRLLGEQLSSLIIGQKISFLAASYTVGTMDPISRVLGSIYEKKIIY
ncbi:hypothetical protein [Wolbachia endosymbiont of Tetranychus urticae]|uniref:hypothetical protein n=1 Tax=Wolbachia endosymbiont of Tetranychus urticae TaxID=169184 RepID=UPI00397E351D